MRTNRATPATEFWALCALLPWSLDVAVVGRAHLHFPAELLVGWMVLRLVAQWHLFLEKWRLLSKIGRFALILPLCWLLWGWFCVPMSSMVGVSAKYMLVATAHAVVFLGFPLLYPSEWKKGLTVFGISLCGVVGYAVFRHIAYFGLRNDQANLAPMPFFDDHTIYACVLLFVIPLLFWTNKNRWLIPILIVGLVLSTCRAAWLSGGMATGVVLLAWLWHRWRILGALVLGAGLLVAGLGWGKATELLRRDVSGAERWNRYQSAIEMAAERPIFGFGPGTYAYQYLPYQNQAHRTRISLDTPLWHRDAANYGHGGGAHSEYMQALSETGWLGLLVLVLWAFFPVYRCMTQGTGWLLLFGWATYWTHGLLNNFLHDPRAAYLVWGIWSVLVFKERSENEEL
jgi:putative inorganic carbon (hco3(-)) transporter